MQDALGDQDAGIFPPLFRWLAVRRDDLVEIGAGRDPELEAVILLGILPYIMKDRHDEPLPWRSVLRACRPPCGNRARQSSRPPLRASRLLPHSEPSCI